jgi:hypothetical protein
VCRLPNREIACRLHNRYISFGKRSNPAPVLLCYGQGAVGAFHVANNDFVEILYGIKHLFQM